MTARHDDLLNDVVMYFAEESAQDYDTLALRLFSYQYNNNIPYKRFCDGRGVKPSTVTRWQDVPPAPASAFKRFALTCVPESECTPSRNGRVFYSSGTTGRETSRHFMDTNGYMAYSLSAGLSYARFVEGMDTPLPILALMPSPDAAPHSSLSFMLERLMEVRRTIENPAPRNGRFFHEPGWQNVFADTLRTLETPHVLFGTAFAWVLFFDSVGETFQLPEGTIVIETGGFKGRSREIPRDELYQIFTDRLGVPDSHCIAEYGMSEMASQFYDSKLYDLRNGITRPRRKISSPWLRTRVFDPMSGDECPHGVPGLLAHYDLANINSVFAIQTEDMGYTLEDGGFILQGRAPGAVLRGCSLLAESSM